MAGFSCCLPVNTAAAWRGSWSWETLLLLPLWHFSLVAYFAAQLDACNCNLFTLLNGTWQVLNSCCLHTLFCNLLRFCFFVFIYYFLFFCELFKAVRRSTLTLVSVYFLGIGFYLYFSSGWFIFFLLFLCLLQKYRLFLRTQVRFESPIYLSIFFAEQSPASTETKWRLRPLGLAFIAAAAPKSGEACALLSLSVISGARSSSADQASLWRFLLFALRSAEWLHFLISSSGILWRHWWHPFSPVFGSFLWLVAIN